MKSRIASDLHALIHSMSQHEKRYFKLYAALAGKRKDNNYLDLYEGMSRLSVYSDAQLQAWAVGKRYEKALPSTVHHLFSLILKALKSCHADKKASVEIRSLLDSAQLLTDRDLHRAAMRLTRRAVKKAQQVEASLELVEALALERKLLFRLGAKSLYEEVEAQQQKTQEILARLQDEYQLQALQDQHRALRMQRLDPRFPSQEHALGTFMQHELLGEVEAQSFKGKLAYHATKGNQSLLSRDHDRAYHHLETCVGIWEAHPDHLSENPWEYLNDLADLLNASLYSMRWLTAGKVLEKIGGLNAHGVEQEKLLANQVHYAALILYLNAGQYEACEAVIAEIRTILEEEVVEIPQTRRLNYCYNITIYYFVQEDYQEAAHWLNHILNAPSGKLKQHLRDFARIFQLLLQYELGNHDLLEYLFRSAYRYYKSRKALYQFEKTVFDAIRAMVQGERPIREIAKELYGKLWEIARALDRKAPAGMYELIFWAQSKFEERPLQAVFQDRVDERMALVQAKEEGVMGDDLASLQERELR